MGVPGFFLWLMKKYNKTDLIVKKEGIEELDNIDYFLIDTNCLIHPVCFKIIEDNPCLHNINILENKMFDAIIEYIDKIINYVNPKIGIYIAIDGVAPLAKIKQQRQRRFKSYADKILWNNIKKKYSKPISSYWNNSAITPGTKFMDKLHQRIIKWCDEVINKSIIYSSYLTPGEGEHKLLQFIRNNQLVDKNYSYVLYGLDADLIFLSLTTNSDKIYLLREGNQINNKSDNILKYVNIKILRRLIFDTIINLYKKKYIDNINKTDINIFFDQTRIINDFIFMCYFLGNDFIPHIPSLDIHQNGIEYLIYNYIDTFNELNIYLPLIIENHEIDKKIDLQYLLDGKNINNTFFENFLNKLSIKEADTLKYNYEHKHKIFFNGDINNKYEYEIFKIENLQFKIDDPIKLGLDSYDEYRIKYYKHYWNVNDDELEEFSQKIVKNYIYGLKWITLYYFDKNPSWDWYYPFDHPPFITDIYKYNKYTNFNKVKFAIGRPVKPFIQLLLVLPLQSSYLLPNTLKKYINDISYLYPIKFEQDFLNKKKYWMGIPLLPPLDIYTVKTFYNKYKKELSIEDKKLNKKISVYEKIFN